MHQPRTLGFLAILIAVVGLGASSPASRAQEAMPTWLTGVVTSVVGAQLVIAANARAEGLVLPGKDVRIYNPDDMNRVTASPVEPGGLVFAMNEAGGYVPIGFLTEISTRMEEGYDHAGYPRSMVTEGRFISSGWSSMPASHFVNAQDVIKRSARVRRTR